MYKLAYRKAIDMLKTYISLNILSRVQWLRRGFGLVNRFTGPSLVVTTISSYTLKITVTIAHVTSHVKSSNSSSGNTSLPLELWKSSEVNSHSRILISSRHGPRTENTVLLLHSANPQTTQKTSHVITISSAHWRADCCLATSYKHSSYCCVRVSWGVYRAVAWQCVDMSQYVYICYIYQNTKAHYLWLCCMLFVTCLSFSTEWRFNLLI
jgi:hypothetical protein